jgi:uncharacterized membrane protein
MAHKRSWRRSLGRMVRHLWLDEADAHRAIPPELATQLAHRVAASEQRHTGQIRFYVEAALPMGYLWRQATPRERALAIFGKLRVWDTEHNNGVLIYLLLAERAIEIVADRGLGSKVAPEQWQAVVSRMRPALRERRFEEGLTQALEEVSALLIAHFPAQPGAPKANELPDEPVIA